MGELILVGGGLAGSEAAWQAAERGVDVALFEMRPRKPTPAHTTDRLAELVCSNSLGSNLPDRAAGVLKAELRRLGSLVLECAEQTAVPAGSALAVDRDVFAELVTRRIESHPRIRLVREEVRRIPAGACIIASGPLTSDALAADLARLTGQAHLYFYDALAPIVTAESIDRRVAFRASRYGRDVHGPALTVRQAHRVGLSKGAGGDGDYLNCPMTRDQYYAFVEALLGAERIALREFESDIAARGVKAGYDRFFEGCLPVEIIAARGRDSLAFGPMRPVGLRDPRTGRRPHAVVQLRQDDLAGTLYNLVGFQTNLTWPEQKRVFRMIPGLENADFVRYGQMHRNTFINAPTLLDPTMGFRARAGLFFAGQITGVEGYVGNAATGLLAGVNAARWLRGESLWTLPRETMLGALCWYVTHADSATFQPMKANFGLLPPLGEEVRNKRDRAAAYAERARHALDGFISVTDDQRIFNKVYS